MLDSKLILNLTSFTAKPEQGKGVVSLIRKLQAGMRNSSSSLTKAQTSFVDAPAMAIAKEAGWLSRNPILLKEDSLLADEFGIKLERGKAGERIAYTKLLASKEKNTIAQEFIKAHSKTPIRTPLSYS